MTIDDLERLLETREQPGIEYKAPAPFQGPFRPHLASTIVAMANHPGGGTIIIGVTTIDGHHAIAGLASDDARSYDPTPVTNYLANYLDPVPTVLTSTITHPTGTVVVLQVPEFTDTPILVIRTLQGDRLHARDGDLLIRSTACETRRVQDADELRALLGRAITRKSEDLLEHIRAIVTGATPRSHHPSPAEQLTNALPDWNHARDQLDKDYPTGARWEFQTLALPKPPPLEPKLATVLLHASKVSYRGWSCPHLPMNQPPEYYQDYLSIRTDNGAHQELLHASYDGSIAFRRILWTDLATDPTPTPQRTIGWRELLWSITEFFRVSLNLVESYRGDEAWMHISLSRIKGRILANHTNDVDLDLPHEPAPRDMITSIGSFPLADLQSAWKHHAIRWTRRFLLGFQWPDPPDALLTEQQERLLQRRW